jgi:hypothetical protein
MVAGVERRRGVGKYARWMVEQNVEEKRLWRRSTEQACTRFSILKDFVGLSVLYATRCRIVTIFLLTADLFLLAEQTFL